MRPILRTTERPWNLRPELPESAEILEDSRDKLPENPVDQPWESEAAYLEAQYQILRCEATEGLRYSVRGYARARSRDVFDDEHTFVYPEVRVVSYLLSKLGPIARVEFSTAGSRYKINWLQSKRLMPGKLVALSTRRDGFRRHCILATVAQRPYLGGLDQNPPQVDLMFASVDDAVFDPALELIMLESKHGYFEAARHTLVGLQEVAKSGSPLMKFLTGADTADSFPNFILQNPIMDLSSLVHRVGANKAHDLFSALKRHNVVGGAPESVPTTLDDSQIEALHRIVSQELAIVQGPPGTGKTFTTVNSIKAMVATRRRNGGPPIVVATQTNHALDHILVQCLEAGMRLVRVGGRPSESVKEHTLHEVRQRCRLTRTGEYKAIEAARRENMDAIQALVDQVFGKTLLDPKDLRDTGVITEPQYKSLEDDEMEIHPRFQKQGGVFALWLRDSLVPGSTLRTQPRPLHAQLEAESPPEDFETYGELFNNIAEDEEDQDRIKGRLVPLTHSRTGKGIDLPGSLDRLVERELLKRDLFMIPTHYRGVVYQHFQSSFLEAVRMRFIALLRINADLCRQAKSCKWQEDVRVIGREGVDIVGCTTTGLSKYRELLSALRPKSLLIEEAAETREANIVSALYPTIEQLILVGDHQQLAPKCDIKWLGSEPYNLDVSLFQRMVNLGKPYTMLKLQRRMKPELRKILSPFYPRLEDHPLVANRPDVPGMGGKNCWFFHHDWPEETTADHSRCNDQEADMITGFFSYLVANDVPSDKITVLTFYTGQQKTIYSKLRKHGSLVGSALKVCTVDSYQGEENDIILLSLVRSAGVGFLEDQRRAMVAISRARRGLYLFGNIQNLLKYSASHELWQTIWNGFHSQGNFSRNGLRLVCKNHNRIKFVREVEDWDCNAGGCDQACSQIRPCGHGCTLRCHPMAHEHLGCSHACQRKLECGHFCESFCSQACSCSCAQFAALKLGRHRSGDVPLEQFLLQSAGAPSAMVQAALDRVNSPTTASTSPTPATALPPLQHESVLRARQDFIRRVAENEERQQKERAAETFSRLQMSSSNTAPVVIKDIYRPTNLVDGMRADKGHKLVQLVELPKFAGNSLLPKSAPTTTLKNSPSPVVARYVGQGRETQTPTEGVEALEMSNLTVGSKLPSTKGVGPKVNDEWLIEL